MNDLNSNDSAMNIIAQAISKMKSEQGEDFSYANVNLAELSRLSGLSRQRLRTLQSHGFKELPHGNKGRIAASSVLDGYTDQLNELLKAGITNSSVCLERLRNHGYTGSCSTIKRYIKNHMYLVPAKRQIVSPQGNRGRRYQTGPGETFQMDWGFAKVSSD